MRNNLILICLFCLCTCTFAQNYSQIGAIGHYDYSIWPSPPGTFPEGYVTIEAVDDTVIQGKQSTILQEMIYTPSGLDSGITYFVYAADSIVYDFDPNNNFSMGILYDYRLMQGDSLVLGNHPITIHIDTVYTEIINGKNRVIQHTSQRSLGLFFDGKNIQGIGNYSYFFPTVDGDQRSGLRCYEDNYIGNFHYPGSDSCTAIITSLEEHAASENLIEFYSNPAKDKIWLKKFRNASANSVGYKIFNAEGRLVRAHEDFMLDEAIDIKNFRPGVYFIFLVIDGKERLGKFVKR